MKKLLIANRGEIAIRIMRAATELDIRTVGIYTHEDRLAQHRFKSDESYEIGNPSEPLKPYLDIEEILKLSKTIGVDAIHPGYGFLSENVEFARKCKEAGITFIGPDSKTMKKLGDKISSKEIARESGVPVIEDCKINPKDFSGAISRIEKIGFPVIIKATSGGGGRGMRVVRDASNLERNLKDAASEAKKSFGDGTVYVEKYIEDPRHIEVQILADNHGNIIHLFERDCSVQRRFQKVVEIAPAWTIPNESRKKIRDYALKICKKVQYNNAGTVEFLLDSDYNPYFIEVNPRVQVEHTVTEQITGIDIIRSQILIAQGKKLNGSEINISSQESVTTNGYAVQCRITTERPEENFKPDYGEVIEYRNATGFGVRLDEGNIYSGVVVSPFYDSMLVKITTYARSMELACKKMYRTLIEFRIRGVNTNLGFLQNLILHKDFIKGNISVNFIEKNPELLISKISLNRANRTINYISDVIVNGNPQVKKKDDKKLFSMPKVPYSSYYDPFPKGSKNEFDALGRDAFVKKLKEEKKIHFTDTTFRDAHQSLLATRVRGYDLFNVAESFAKKIPQVFSMEVWGGATFDVCMRFLYECPWRRLQILRKKIPNILFQMLLRGSNGVGYTSYPDNLIQEFVIRSAENGIDIFRIFDSLNWVENMKSSIKTVREKTSSLAEGSICYTGNILDKENKKYTLQYYSDLAKELEDIGVHILAIKDMAGLLTPYAAQALIEELKTRTNLPIHLHTHDTSSIQSATYLKAIESGVDIVDVSLASMSGMTSQPNFNSLLHALKGSERENEINTEDLDAFSNYWETTREYYYPFESEIKSGTAEVYAHEIPGGQYSNLKAQATSLGLGEKIDDIKKNYATANKIFGDIVKVTPSSKVVGDMALFMTSNSLSEEDIFEKGDTLAFPESVKSFLKGKLGQPVGGFPEKIQKIVLREEKPFTDKPNSRLKPINFDKALAHFREKFDARRSYEQLLSFLLYPKVYEEYYRKSRKYGNLEYLDTKTFFYGMKPGEEISVEIQKGKKLIVKYLFASEPNKKGLRMVSFLLNGKMRRIPTKDLNFKNVIPENKKVDLANLNEIGSPLQGRLSKVFSKIGEEVDKNTPLFTIEAMKMETTITASKKGKVETLILKEGSSVEQDDLVMIIV